MLLIFAVPFRYSLFLFSSRPFLLGVHCHKISDKIRRLLWTSSPSASASQILEVLWLFSRNRGPLVSPWCVTRKWPFKDLSNNQNHQTYVAPPLWSFAIMLTQQYLLSGCTPLPAMTHCHFQNIKDDVKNVILSFSCRMFFSVALDVRNCNIILHFRFDFNS